MKFSVSRPRVTAKPIAAYTERYFWTSSELGLTRWTGASSTTRPFSINSETRRHPQHQFEVLFDQQDRQRLLLDNTPQRACDLLHDRRLNAFGGFVQQQEFRFADEGTHDRELLLLSARHRAGALPPPFAQDGEGLVCPVRNFVRQFLLADHPHEQVLFGREVAEDLAALGHVADAEIGDLVRWPPQNLLAIERNRSLGRREMSRDRTQHR